MEFPAASGGIKTCISTDLPKFLQAVRGSLKASPFESSFSGSLLPYVLPEYRGCCAVQMSPLDAKNNRKLGLKLKPVIIESKFKGFMRSIDNFLLGTMFFFVPA